MEPDAEQLTELLNRARHGQKSAAEKLMPIIYQELRRRAGAYMRMERPGHTLQPTALVHEAYLKMFGQKGSDFQNRTHFFALAARQMRAILTDYARERAAAKRGGGAVKINLDDLPGLAEKRFEDLDVIDEALLKLEALDARAAQVVELRFFGGLSEEEAAEALGVSLATVKRDWDFAKTWLRGQFEPARKNEPKSSRSPLL